MCPQINMVDSKSLVALLVILFPCFVRAVPWRDCRKPLFLDRYDPTISMFSASSSEQGNIYDASKWPYPYLQKDPTVNQSGWCPDFNKIDGPVYLEVDLGMDVNITGISTQGESHQKRFWTERYTLNFSSNGVDFYAHTPPSDGTNEEDKRLVFSGNDDVETVVTHWFPADRKVTARFVRVVCLSCRSDLICCLRFELFGCDGGTRNPMGFIHGQIAPRYFEVTNYLLYGKEYIYSGLKNMAKGWRFYQGLNGIFRLNLPNNYLFTGISVRACNGTSPCELPARFGAYMKTKTNSWIPLACTKDEDGGSANSIANVSFMFWPDMKKCVFSYKMIALATPRVGKSMEFFDMSRSHLVCEFPAIICLHLEFYGKDIECKYPFGVEWGHRHDRSLVKDDQMTASSTESGSAPHFGRLGFSSKAWCPQESLLQNQRSKMEQYLQIDFIIASKITGVSTQGLGSNVVTSYVLYYALDVNMFHCIVNEYGLCKVVKGNSASDGDSESIHWLTSPLTVRFLRFNPKTWLNSPCLRVEVYGCKPGPCYSSLGMECGMIDNSQVTASSETQANKKEWSRLNSIGWCVGGAETYYYLRIDLRILTLVTAVVTQGKYEEVLDGYAEAVTSFYLKYSLMGDKWLKYHTLLTGEYKGNHPVRHWLDPPFVAQHVEFNPRTSFTRHMCMRVEVYGCYTQEFMPDLLTLGMESFSIGDSQLTASSQKDQSGPECARLNHIIDGGAWVPKTSNLLQFLQIDTGWIVILTGIAVQGHPTLGYHIQAFQIKLATNLNQQFELHPRGKVPKEFVTVDKGAGTMFHTISATGYCRYVQIHPVSWVEQIALRVELYGHEADCSKRLGLIGGEIGDQQLSSSSFETEYRKPIYGRINLALGYGAWSPSVQDQNQYLQVDLLKEMYVSGVATQGSKFYDCWVSSYKLLFRGLGPVWRNYSEADIEQQIQIIERKMLQYLGPGVLDNNSPNSVISANQDRDTIALHFFSVVVVTRYVRFLPQSWNNEICMRIELYGCPLDQFSCGESSGCSNDSVCMTIDKEMTACVCKDGYRGDGKTCEDVNECVDGVNPCIEHTDCVNTVGSFDCPCSRGFRLVGSSCEDIDECKLYGCPSSMACINTIGSFTCDCGSGRQYDVAQKTCVDLDECTTGQYSCHPFASCVNNIGSYSCECSAGYRGPSRTVCIDIDECQDKPNLCGRNSVCSNTNGGYQCLCESGYVRRNHSCVDYDECANRDHKCRRYSSCVNTVGSYRCNCKKGFYSNGPYCVDLNECQGGHNCDVNAWCTNTSGSYRCVCKKGYRGNGMTCERRDISYCEPGDENCQSFAGVPKLGIP